MNYKYYYNGEPLVEYCKKNPKYNNMSEDEIIDMVLNKHIVGDVQMLDFMNEESKKLSLRPDDN